MNAGTRVCALLGVVAISRKTAGYGYCEVTARNCCSGYRKMPLRGLSRMHREVQVRFLGGRAWETTVGNPTCDLKVACVSVSRFEF